MIYSARAMHPLKKIVFKGSTGLAINASGEIFQSLNNGATWGERTQLKAGNLQTIHQVAGNFLIGGDFGTLLSYGNANSTQLHTNNLMRGIKKLVAADANTLFAIVEADPGVVGGLEELKQSLDGGLTWSAANFDSSPPSTNMKDICFSSATQGYAVSQGAFWTSSTAGNRWDQANLQPTIATGIELNCITEESGDIFIGKNDGKFTYSIAGAAFLENTIKSNGTGIVQAISIDKTQQRGVALVDQWIYQADNPVYTDMSSWTWSQPGGSITGMQFVAMHAPDLEHIYALSTDGKIAYSANGGISWSIQADLQLSGVNWKDIRMAFLPGQWDYSRRQWRVMGYL